MRFLPALLAVAVALLGSGALIDGCYEGPADVVPPDAEQAPETPTVDVVEEFGASCAVCHTLAAAGATGTVGPNLDLAGTPVELAVELIRRGSGAMPAFGGTLTDEKIRALAEYVATVAETPPDTAPAESTQAQAPVEPSARAVIRATPALASGPEDAASAVAVNCGACHTLAAAGASGRIGPNLDEHVPDVAVVEALVRHGRGTMPPFGDLLSDDEIRALAAYVVEASASTVSAARR
jgi:mono/diheme cytochrome c family protein